MTKVTKVDLHQNHNDYRFKRPVIMSNYRHHGQGGNHAQSQPIHPEVHNQQYRTSYSSHYMGNVQQQQDKTGGYDARAAATAQQPLQHTAGDYDGRTGANVHQQQSRTGDYDGRTGANVHPQHSRTGDYDGRTGAKVHPQHNRTGDYDGRTGANVHPQHNRTGDYDGRAGANVYQQHSRVGGYDGRSGAHAHPHLDRHDDRCSAGDYMHTERHTSERFSELSGDIIQKLREVESIRANEAETWSKERQDLLEQIQSLENDKEKLKDR